MCLVEYDIVGIELDVFGFSALTKYILNNIDHGAIPMMTLSGK